MSPSTVCSTSPSRAATSWSRASCRGELSNTVTRAPAAASTGPCWPPPEARHSTGTPGQGGREPVAWHGLVADEHHGPVAFPRPGRSPRARPAGSTRCPLPPHGPRRPGCAPRDQNLQPPEQPRGRSGRRGARWPAPVGYSMLRHGYRPRWRRAHAAHQPELCRAGYPGLLRYRPETGRPLSELAEVLLRGPGTLTRGERELIAAYVSGLNDCRVLRLGLALRLRRSPAAGRAWRWWIRSAPTRAAHRYPAAS